MMTSRAEYRLLLRQDNADLRLCETGYRMGLVSEERIRRVREKKALIENEITRLKKKILGATQKNNHWLEEHGSSSLKTGVSLAELICRPELNYDAVADLDPERKELPAAVKEQINIEVKYEGYIKRQEQQVKQFKKMENKKLPQNLDYKTVKSLRLEAIQKLNIVKPSSIGQASRISGVSPADISVLLVWLEANK